ncbi:MFS transporter [Corynebacterium casei]|uniref:MFS transporter n=1 Tax=Corynebacterium casei TaxID=160386 RepID=UPI003F8E3EC1
MRFLVTAYFLLSLCGTMTSVAISLHFAAHDGGAALISAILVSSACAQIFIAPLLAPVFDRFSARSIAIAATVCEVVLLGIILVVPIAPVLIGVSLLSSALAGLSIPALFTIADEYGDKKNQAATFSMLDTARLVGSFVGPVLSGLLLDIWSLRAAISVEIAANLIALAILLVLKQASSAPESDDDPKTQSFLARVLEAPALLLRNEQSRAALMSIWAAIIFTSVFSVALVFYAVDVLGAGGLGYAFLMQAFVVGRILGARRSKTIAPPRALAVLTVCGIIMGISIALTGILHNLIVAITCFFIAGICNALQVAALRLVITSAVPAEIQPKALSSMGSVNTSAMLVGYIIGAPIVTAAGPALALMISGVGTALLTALSPLVRNLRSRL